jgi:NDP-sugar pyrophosphorylase family protein
MNVNREAERASSYLQDEFFMGVVEKQRLLYISNILDSRDEDVDLRERERLKLKGLEEFIASLKSISANQEIDKKRKGFFNL